ncbi:hypothetical protein [Massilia sp. BJB1822]|uniref:hypothetical protein n=1 Tax=Massilia sp. BJB1822 TaxID=2744470 RepID=UPI001594D922|nr:hypothetical protein [Massilia sp. BJB1822]NVD96752.1 hypothetical protein [Massilia sp. BJB1822]
MVLFDASILIKLLDPRTSGKQQDKLDYLLDCLQKSRTKILIPTPALAELYVKAPPEVMALFKGRSAFLIVPFDEKAALEWSLQVKDAVLSQRKKGIQADTSWRKIKFDHQIIAIAKVNRTNTIYSEDTGLCKLARALGLTALGVDELPDKPN